MRVINAWFVMERNTYILLTPFRLKSSETNVQQLFKANNKLREDFEKREIGWQSVSNDMAQKDIKNAQYVLCWFIFFITVVQISEFTHYD